MDVEGRDSHSAKRFRNESGTGVGTGSEVPVRLWNCLFVHYSANTNDIAISQNYFR